MYLVVHITKSRPTPSGTVNITIWKGEKKNSRANILPRAINELEYSDNKYYKVKTSLNGIEC